MSNKSVIKIYKALIHDSLRHTCHPAFMVRSSKKPVIALYCTRSALEYLAKSKWTSNDTQDKRSPPSAAHLILVIYLILLLVSMFQEDRMHPYLQIKKKNQHVEKQNTQSNWDVSYVVYYISSK